MTFLAAKNAGKCAFGILAVGVLVSGCSSSGKDSVETTRSYSYHEKESSAGEALLKAPQNIVQAVAKVLPGNNSDDHTNDETKFSSKDFGVKGSPRISKDKAVRKGGGRYQIGKKYTIRGRTYHPKEDPNYNAVGLASWYGPNFHGRLTANGEVYDQYALSAAHPTLPLPSYVKVTNMENGSSVVVRVNDRGPFAHDRVIDLSARAAELLGYTKKGLAKVKVEYAGKAPLHGLDEEMLVASYNPGQLDPSNVPPNGRGYILVASANEVNGAEAPVLANSFTPPVPSSRPLPGVALVNTTPETIVRPKVLVNSYASDTNPNGKAHNAMNWFNNPDGQMQAPDQGMNDLQRIRFGSFESAAEFSRAEKLLSGFGYVNTLKGGQSDTSLVLTTVAADYEKVIDIAARNNFTILPSN